MGGLMDFFIYVKAGGGHWFGVVGGVLLMASDLFDRWLPPWKRFADRIGFTAPVRRIAEFAFLVVALLWAGFKAWDVEYTARSQAEKRIANLEGQLATYQALREQSRAANPIPAPTPPAYPPPSRSSASEAAPNPTPGPLSAADFPVMAVSASLSSGDPGRGYLVGIVSADDTRKTALFDLELTSQGFLIAIKDSTVVEGSSDAPKFSRNIKGLRMRNGLYFEIAMKPNSLALFSKSRPKIVAKLTASNGQTYLERLPIVLRD